MAGDASNRAEIWISAFACIFSGIAAIASVAGAWISWQALDQMQAEMASNRNMDACVALARASNVFNGAAMDVRRSLEQNGPESELPVDMKSRVQDAQRGFDLAAIALTYLVDDKQGETIRKLGEGYAAVSTMIDGNLATPKQISDGMDAARPGEAALHKLCGGLVGKAADAT